MEGQLRNSFLCFSCLGLLLVLLGGCAVHQQGERTADAQQRLPVMGYAIQVGAFADPENAMRLTLRLSSLGLPAYYFRGDGNFYRVRFGNYRTYELARDSASRLQNQKVVDVFIVVRPDSYPAVRYRDQPDYIREQVVAIAQQFVGVPYRWGDASPVLGFDCSGLAMMVYQLVGFNMPRVSRDQFRSGAGVVRAKLRPADLVFFRTDSSGKVSHVGIYVGNDQFIHAPSSGKTVIRSSLSSAYFQKQYLGARSFL